MATLLPDGNSETCDQHLENWPTFSTKYYEPVRDILKLLLRAPEDEAHDAAIDFLLKAERNDYLGQYKRSRVEREARGEPTRHRDFLMRSLKNHVVDIHRRAGRSKESPLLDEAADALSARPDEILDPDVVYALLILHRALQALRHHCERTGRPHVWVCFQELLLAPEFRDGRPSRSHEELAQDLGKDKQFVHNSLTTAKRAFQRFVHDAVPDGLRDDETASSRFEEWMSILRRSNAAQFNRLHVAYQVWPYLDPNQSQAESYHLAMNDSAVAYEEPALLPSDDELSLLLSFRLEMPLHETIPVEDIRDHIPATSPLLPIRRGKCSSASARPFCLLSLIEPTAAESNALAPDNALRLLVRLKSMAKQLHHRPDPGMPAVFAQLLYTLAIVTALVRHDERIHSIGSETLSRNIRWFLRQSWLDDRLAPIFRRALRLLEATPESAPPNEL